MWDLTVFSEKFVKSHEIFYIIEQWWVVDFCKFAYLKNLKVTFDWLSYGGFVHPCWTFESWCNVRTLLWSSLKKNREITGKLLHHDAMMSCRFLHILASLLQQSSKLQVGDHIIKSFRRLIKTDENKTWYFEDWLKSSEFHACQIINWIEIW